MRIYHHPLNVGDTLELASQEAKHATKVMRLKVGDCCEVFDGQGQVAVARLEEIEKSSAWVVIESVQMSPKELPGSLTLAIGLPKGERQRSVVERATELGVHLLVPLGCEFGVAEATENAIARAERTVQESCKQCQRNRFMQFAPRSTCKDWFTRAVGDETIRLLAHPGIADALKLNFAGAETIRRKYSASPPAFEVAIGPEGGFSGSEVNCALENGWLPLDLGPRILRVETALAAAVSFVSLFLSND